MDSSTNPVAVTGEPSSIPTTLPVELDTLRKQYFALVPPYLLHLPSPQTLRSAAAQEALVELAETEDPPQPEAGYRKKFWKRVLGVLEESFEDADGDEDGVS